MKLKNPPLVTVYVLNHNYGKFLKDAVNSVIQQSYKNIEIILIDDGSSDNSDKVISELLTDNKRIKIIKNESPKGLIRSANSALSKAAGDYIVRLDADDFFEPNAINDLVVIDIDASFIRTVFKEVTDQELNELDVPIHGACTLINLEWLLSQKGYDEKYTRQDGYYLWALASATGRFFCLTEKVIFNYRQHRQSLSSDRVKLLHERTN